jgi:hypothetical protein
MYLVVRKNIFVQPPESKKRWYLYKTYRGTPLSPKDAAIWYACIKMKLHHFRSSPREIIGVLKKLLPNVKKIDPKIFGDIDIEREPYFFEI